MLFEQPIFNLILTAIKDADRGLFFKADYEKQALDVMKALETSGFKIVPKNPNQNMILSGRKCIEYGITNPRELVKQIYETMINGV